MKKNYLTFFALVVLVVLVVLSFVMSSRAQQATALPSEVLLRVTPAELDIISDGLQSQPFGKVAPLMNKLREQVVQQQRAVAPATTVAPGPAVPIAPAGPGTPVEPKKE